MLHEGTDQVKETKISMLVHQYKMFKMLEHDNIDEMTTRFMHIINQLKTLAKRHQCRNGEKDSEESFKGLASKSHGHSRS